jgi:hypothetical protein
MEINIAILIFMVTGSKTGFFNKMTFLSQFCISNKFKAWVPGI